MRNNSEIFASFVKIAQEKGLISSDESKKKLERLPRADSLSVSDIEALYGVKPDAPKGMEYERNIMEDAHPNSVVIAPSYDKLNGLVENNNERQDILLHIVNKTPNGLSTQHKYAKQDLIMTLVRVANDLDNKNEEELRVLADTCLLQASEKKKLTKTAEPVTMAILIGTAALLGGLYLKNHMRFIDEGFKKDHQNLISEIDDMLNDSASWGTGYKYKAEFMTMLHELKAKLIIFYTIEQKIEPIITQLQTPKTAKELMELSKNAETDTVIKAYRDFKSAAEDMLPYIITIEKDFSSEAYKQRQVEDKGWMTNLLDKTQVLHGGKGLIADDFDDVAHAIGAYKKAMADIAKVLENAESLEKSATKQMQQAALESQQMFGAEKSVPGTQSNKTVEDIDQEANSLSSELEGIVPGLG